MQNSKRTIEFGDSNSSNTNTKPPKRYLRTVLVALMAVFLAGFLFGIYTYVNARPRAIRLYKKIYQNRDLSAFEEFATASYRQSADYRFRQSYFQDGAEVSIDLSDANIEISYKKNVDEFTLKKVPFTLKKDSSQVKVLRDVTFKRDGIFNYGLEKEEYPLLDDISPTKNVSKTGIEFSEDLLNEVEKNLPTNPREITKQILGTINRWKVAWVAKDLDRYMSLYSEYARITRVTVDKYGNKIETNELNKAQLRERMQKLNEKYNAIYVEVYDPRVYISTENGVRTEELKVEAKFGQLFIGQSGSYRYTDYGNKILKFRHEDNNWKIVEESWQPHKTEMKKLKEIFPEFF